MRALLCMLIGLLLPLTLPARDAWGAKVLLDPVDGFAVALPAKPWRATLGVGAVRLFLQSPTGGWLVVRSGEAEGVTRQDAQRRAARLLRGATLLDTKREQCGTATIEERRYRRSPTRGGRGALLIAHDATGAAEILVVDDEEHFLTAYLLAHEILEAFLDRPGREALTFDGDTVRVPPFEALGPRTLLERQGATAESSHRFSAAAGRVVARALYALLDGGSGVSSMAEEMQRLARTADAGERRTWTSRLRRAAALMTSGDAAPRSPDALLAALIDCFEGAIPDIAGYRVAARALRLQREGRLLAAAKLLPRGAFFSMLIAAHGRIEAGDGAGARELLPKQGGRVRMHSCRAAALSLSAARLVGEHSSVDDASGQLCAEGSAAARLASERAFACLDSDPSGAIDGLRRAIELNPAAPAPYLALARALLDRGDGSAATIAEMRRLLQSAPNIPAIRRLRRRLEGLSGAASGASLAAVR